MMPSSLEAQEIDEKIMKQVRKRSMNELKKIYNDPLILTNIRDIKSTMKVSPHTTPQWSDLELVDMRQVSFDVEVWYNKIVDPEIGEIASFKETLRCILSKYRSVDWNRLSFYQNDCQDCGDQNLVELKRAVNERFIVTR